MRVLGRILLAFLIAIFVVVTLLIVLVLESRRSVPRWVERAGEDLTFQDTEQQWRPWRTK
jgi:hypothetical protein